MLYLFKLRFANGSTVAGLPKPETRFDRIPLPSLPSPAEFKPAPDVANPQASFGIFVRGRPRHGSHGALAISGGGKSVARTISRGVTGVTSYSVTRAISRSVANTISQSLAHPVNRSLADSDNVTEAGPKIVRHAPGSERYQ